MATRSVADRLVLSPQEPLVAGGPAEAFESQLRQLYRTGQKHLVIDFTRVPAIDSAGIRALVRGHTTAQRVEGTSAWRPCLRECARRWKRRTSPASSTSTIPRRRRALRPGPGGRFGSPYRASCCAGRWSGSASSSTTSSQGSARSLRKASAALHHQRPLRRALSFSRSSSWPSWWLRRSSGCR